MFYATAFLFILGIYFAVSGFRAGDPQKKGMALALFVSGFGTLLILFFAFSALDI